jgi:hypothetical protein
MSVNRSEDGVGLDTVRRSEMQHYELRVTTTAQQQSITPTSGKRIRIFGFQASQLVSAALTATLRASLSFGTGGVSDASKVLGSYRLMKGDDAANMQMCSINVVGAVDETVTLTNVTFSGGSVITRAIIYYIEE